MSEDLVTWLRAQIDEDERMVQAYLDAGEEPGTTQDLPSAAPWADFERLCDPARVLAEVEAKRGILDLAESAARRGAMKVGYDPVARLEKSLAKVTAPELERVVRLLALPYADRPGYREEWRP